MVFILFSIFASTAFAETTPADHALQIVQAQPTVVRLSAELRREAGKIKDARLRQSALEILDIPKFTVIEARKASADDIEKQLRAAGLLAADAHVFPSRAPLPFLASPGSPWRAHHAYPGGLLRHELVNLKTALAASATYRDVYNVELNEDWLRAAPIWHDCAKTITVAWNADGTANSDEGQIAGTGAHHILGIAEAAFRGFDPKFIVVLASAHNPPLAGAGLENLLKYLKAAALIAGKPNAAVGLSDDGTRLLTDPPIEAFVHHLSDHDWVLTQATLPKVVEVLGDAQGVWATDTALARYGDVFLYQELLKGGPEALRALTQSKNASPLPPAGH